MWGWTDLTEMIRQIGAVNPTYVGMDRKIPSPMTQSSSKPHVCGDGPGKLLKVRADTTVNPTYVGMDRHHERLGSGHKSKPHARGDEP